MRKTKIVCTLGPATNSFEVLKNLVASGMDVARFNFSHGLYDEHKVILDNLRKAAYELHSPLATMLDTKGPELRLGNFNDTVELIKDSSFTLTTEDIIGDNTKASVNYKNLYKDVSINDKILLNDGLIELKVTSIEDTNINCTIINSGTVSSHKSINIPGIHLNLPYISEQDYNDILFGIENHFDFIAASFVNTPEDILAIRKILQDNNANNIKIISKIESVEALKNFDAILNVSDAIMVARGDLGVENPIEQVPIIQKNIITKCYRAGKPVITATQMLESMIENPRPTRAEVSDVANAIFDSTSAIMLSAETAVGHYPCECVQTMVKIANEVENTIDYWERFKIREQEIQNNDKSVINYASCLTSMHMNTKAILAFTLSGETARLLSRFRPNIPIYAITPEEHVYKQLALSWGVTPIHIPGVYTIEQALEVGINKCINENLLSKGDLVVISGGYNDNSGDGGYRLNKVLGGILRI